MEEDVKTLSDYVSVAWRRKFYILVPFVVALSITTATILMLPPVYQSTGTILIESQQIPEELVESTVTSYADERIQVIEQRIMTGERLYGLIEKYNLYAEEIGSTPRSEILENMRNQISIELVSADVTNRRRRANATIAFTVSFEHGEAGATQRVTNELVTLFLDENIRSRTERAKEATDFLRKESELLGAQIAVIEEQIASFKQQHEGSLPENSRVNLQQIVTLNATLLATDAELSELNERRDLLLIDLETLQHKAVASGGLTEEQYLQNLELIQDLQNQYISLSARYGSVHPDVKAIKRQITAFEEEYGNIGDIEELQSQEQETKLELIELTKKYSSEHPDVKKLERKLDGIATMITEFNNAVEGPQENGSNPELLQAKARLTSVESSIERIKKVKLDTQSQIVELEARVSRTPQVQRGLDALERDYQNKTRKYQDMKGKELQAELSRTLEEDQKGERFTLLEPPVFPDHPIKPNRQKIFLMGLILSFISGIGVAGIAESLDGGIRGARKLAAITKMTPLVTIPYITTRKDEATRKRHVIILIASGAVACIIVLAMVHIFYEPLDLLWLILLRKFNLA